MPAKDPQLYLMHIRDCSKRIMDYTAGLGTAWTATPIILDAVCRNHEIIGEAASKLDESYRKAHPEIPWREITGIRHKLVHDYFIVDLDIVWRTVTVNVPEVEPRLRAVAASVQQRG